MTDAPRHHEAARSNLLMSPLVAIGGFVATVAVVRALAPHDFAVYAVVLAFKGTVQFASDFGTGAAATRLFGELQAQGAGGQARRAYLRLLALRGAIALALVAAVVAAPDAFADLLALDSDERDIVPLLVAIGVAETVSSLGYSVLAGLLRHRRINQAVLASTLIQPAAVILAAAAGLGLTGITAGLLLGSLVRSGGFHVGAIAALRSLDDRAAAQAGMARAYVRTATGSIAAKLAAWIHSRQLVTLIAIQTTARADVAVFALAYDLVQQVVTALSVPFGSLLLPLQASSVGDEERARRIYRTAVRLIAYVVIGPSLVLLALFPALVGGVFGADYEDATIFGVIFIPAFAAEVVLAGPATALMLADDRVLGSLRRIKLAAIVLGALYFALAEADLLLVAGVMMAVRTASTVAMLVVIHRRLGLATLGPWLPRLLAAGVFAAACAGVPQLFLDDDLAAFVAGLALAVVALFVAVRRARVVEPEDAALAAQLVPAAAPLLERLVPGSSRAA
jgi:O-antigen/teichoic acid export membrane protein